MIKRTSVSFLCAATALAFLTSCGSQKDVPVKPEAAANTDADAKPQQPPVDADGTVQLPERSLPYSSLASNEAKKNFIDFTMGFASLGSGFGGGGDINSMRKLLDDKLMRPGVERLQGVLPVTITPEMIGGVQTDVILPQDGIATKNSKRVLINLHGGGFAVAARYGGQQESIPIASVGKIKVITVDYREAPEHQYPAASEDVAIVYKELLKQYRPENIGIYGCSAGGMLTAQAVAWFQTHGLPRPGAIGIFGASGVMGKPGDSERMWAPEPKGDAKKGPDYFGTADLTDPMISPADSPSVLKQFPPTLLISGTRDQMLSKTVYTHAQLVKAGVEADLHVWEGAAHCSFAQPVVDPDVPETRETWDVIVRFFEQHLGKK